MKRLLCLTVVLANLLYAPLACARILPGVRAGFCLADIKRQHTFENYYSDVPYKPKPGIMAGVSLDFLPPMESATLSSGFRIEFLYVQKGAIDQARRTDEQGQDLGWFKAGTICIDELVLTGLFVLRYPKRKIAPFILFGPEVGFNLRAKWENDSDGQTYDMFDDLYSPAWSRHANFGFNFGAGFSLPRGCGETTLDVRYNLGLIDMDPSPATAKTNGIQITVGHSSALPLQSCGR